MKIPRLLLILALPLPAAPVIEKTELDGVSYRLLRVPASAVKILWNDEAGEPLRTFAATAEFLAQKNIPATTLMNGGIFEPGGVPSGLLIQDGKELRPVNRNPGEGNFFLQPNGMFMTGPKGAAMIRTDEYPLADFPVAYAVQSGPLLLRNGVTHPKFNRGSDSRLHRNGVGVARDGQVVLAITDFDSPKFPNLFEFAHLFRVLECDDALFLDGDLSQMRSGADMHKPSNRFGSIIAIFDQAPKSAN